MHAPTLNSLGLPSLYQRLHSQQGLTFDIGPFRVGVKSRLPAIGAHVADMYGEYRISDSDFADLHFSVDAPLNLRALWRKQVNFKFDDESLRDVLLVLAQEAGINILAISTSISTISCLLRQEDLAEARQALEEAFALP